MHGQDGPSHNASQGWVSTARRFGKPAEDVEDVRLRSRLYSATSRPALLTCPKPPRCPPRGRDRRLVRGASAIRRDRLTTEERLSDIVEILAHGLLWLDAFSVDLCSHIGSCAALAHVASWPRPCENRLEGPHRGPRWRVLRRRAFDSAGSTSWPPQSHPEASCHGRLIARPPYLTLASPPAIRLHPQSSSRASCCRRAH